MSTSGSTAADVLPPADGTTFSWRGSEPEQDLPGGTLRYFRDSSAIDCPSAFELADSLRAQLRVHFGGPARVRLSVIVTREESQYVGHVQVEGRKSGVRDLHVPGPDCSALKDALVVSLALILDEEAQQHRPVAVPMPATVPLRPSPPAVRFTDARTLALGLGASLTEGLPHSVSGALSGELQFSSSSWSTALGAFWTPTQRLRFGPGAVDIQLLGGRTRICRSFGSDATESLRNGICAEGLLGQLRGQGRDFTTDQPQRRPWPALGMSVWLGSQPRLPLGWAVRGFVLFPLRQDAFGVTGIEGAAYRMPPISMGCEALFRWRIL